MTISRDFLIKRLPDLCLLVFVIAATVGTFTGGVWAGLGIGLALVACAAVWSLDRRMPAPETRIIVFAFVVLGLLMILNLHSSQAKISWQMWERLATIFLPLSLLTSPAIQARAASARLFLILPWAALAGAAALGGELLLHGPLLKLVRGPTAGLYEYNRGLSYLVILAFPILAGLWISNRRWLAVVFIIVLLLPTSLTESRAAKLALILALATTTAAYFLPALTRTALTALPFLVVGWPFAAQKLFLAHHDWIDRLPPSWGDRMEIWDYMSYRILDRPLLGWGLGSSPFLPFAEPHGALYRYEQGVAAHPHNAAIQLWVELGLPGLALGVVFAILILRRISRLDRRIAPFATGSWVASFCLAMISYNLWSDSLWAAFALTGFAFAMLQKRTAETEPLG